MLCPPCNGTGRGRGPRGTCGLCGGHGVLPNDPSLTRVCVFCNGTGIGMDESEFCPVCGGRGRLGALSPVPDLSAPLVFFVEAGKPRTAYLQLASLFKTITGEIRICDPYYGMGTLLRLDLLEHCSPIKFLTQNPDKNEMHLLPRAIQEWQRQHGAAEFRQHVGSDLHDRYLLSDHELILMGHGLKDIGYKDSFVIRIPSSLAADTVLSVRDSFDQKWENSKSIA